MRPRLGLIAIAAVLLTLAPLPSVSAATGAEPGGAGIQLSLPETDSAVTVRARGPFADLEIKVNQTRDLVNQAVSVSWTGGAPTRSGPGIFAGNYLQIMQCWGEPDGTIPENPGPPPEQCVQGASDGVSGGRLSSLFVNTLAPTRIIGTERWDEGVPIGGTLDEETGLIWRPFRAVDGTVVVTHHNPDFNPALVGGRYWLNDYFNSVTTNEVVAGRTAPSGQGSALFELHTGVQSRGLGCGQVIESLEDGQLRVPKCWLVVVPRGSPEMENASVSPAAGLTDKSAVFLPPVAPAPWANRIAIPLEFQPVDSPCSLGGQERRLSGSELALTAVVSWQPHLCSQPGVPPFTFASASDAGAREQLTGDVFGAPGMVAVSKPIDPLLVAPEDPVVYAPMTASAMVVAYTIERSPSSSLASEVPGLEDLRGLRIATLNLTPRLVAKLLTQSYRSQVAIRGPSPYEWTENNPSVLTQDPDFLRFNPEFELLLHAGKNLGGVLTSGGLSDAAEQVWEWILADPEAKGWLDGAPDEWGMLVNPVYATAVGANSQGIPFADPIPGTFPKLDPYCYQGPPVGSQNVVPPPLCGSDWFPFARDFTDAARRARTTDDGAKTIPDTVNAQSPEQVYKANGPQLPGRHEMMALTDSPQAARYGLQVARLSRAGDGGAERNFIAPEPASMSAALASMAPRAVEEVLEPTPLADAPDAYPLTTLTYAAITPLSLTDEEREDYAAFLDYAGGSGQLSGVKPGQLPLGYTPLPDTLKVQTLAAARTVRELEVAGPDPLPTTTTGTAQGEGNDSSGGDAAANTGPAPRTRSGSEVHPNLSASGGEVTEDPRDATDVAAGSADTDAASTSNEGRRQELLTPALAASMSRYMLPVLIALALGSTLGALEIAKSRPRTMLERVGTRLISRRRPRS